MSSQSTKRNQFPAQDGSGSRSSSSYGNAAVRCHCGIQLELVTSWTDDNPGRRFQACPNYKMPSCCGFFRWFDEEMCSRSKEVIPGLLRKTNKLELLLAAEQEKNKFVQVVLERQANVLEKKERMLKIVIAVMVLIIAFQVMSQPEFGKTMPRQLV
ncbi:hypothetical protein CASFOL_022017 [Castilleja foliolosa]|uniref:GRF-type domain-containing protein n=1 Tax=Castilleja foliolosa TaxID=1961234 RepID=A0ABD3CY79_9LAMI